MRWPKGPPHLALNPPYLFLLFFVFWLFNTKKNLVFPLEKGISCLFSVFLFLSPLAFLASLFLCFSFSVSLFSSFLSFFLLVFVFAFFWFLVLVSWFLFLSSLLFFHERNNIKKFNCKFFLHPYFIIFWFPVFFLSSSFLLSLPFPDFKLCFLFNIKVFGFKTDNQKKTEFFGQKGVATKRAFFNQPLFCKMRKVIVFFVPLFWANFGRCSKNTIK